MVCSLASSGCPRTLSTSVVAATTHSQFTHLAKSLHGGLTALAQRLSAKVLVIPRLPSCIPLSLNRFREEMSLKFAVALITHLPEQLMASAWYGVVWTASKAA